MRLCAARSKRIGNYIATHVFPLQNYAHKHKCIVNSTLKYMHRSQEAKTHRLLQLIYSNNKYKNDKFA